MNEKYLGVELKTDIAANGLDYAIEERERVRREIILKHIRGGVTFLSYDDVYIDDSVTIGEGSVILANNRLIGSTVIGKEAYIGVGNTVTNSKIGSGAKIIDSVICDSEIGSNTSVTMAHVHSGSIVGKDCRVGNYVEIKNSCIGNGTKMAHLAYIGDANTGNYCNVGCGVVFVNYDGKNKHRSEVGNSVFIGSNSNIIAPVRIEDNTYIAAGTTVTLNLPGNSMCIGRPREVIKENRSRYVKINAKKYFGTDGIRGRYGEMLSDDLAYMCGNYLGYSSDFGSIVIGRDTRVSGGAITEALIKGITKAGANVIDLGVVSTPIVAFITQKIGANYGIVVSASHNPPEYNGIKIFNYAGSKLTDLEEDEIEKHIDGGKIIARSKAGKVEKSKNIDDYYTAVSDYIGDIGGLKVALDCANGAVGAIAPQLFTRLGAETSAFNVSGDGSIINAKCGATCAEAVVQAVKNTGADIGLSFDGDADRVIATDENGNLVDGDSIIYIISSYMKERGELFGDTAVGTLHSNMGLEHSLSRRGISVLRTDIGDHNVVRAMIEHGYKVGGEQSGHIILGDFALTGDGILAGLMIMKIMKEKGRKLSELNDMIKYPQININYPTPNGKKIVSSEEIKNFAEETNSSLNGKGRIMLRASGTEPLVRIMAELPTADEADKLAAVSLSKIRAVDEKIKCGQTD